MINRQSDFSTTITGGFITKLQGKNPDLRFQFKFDGSEYDDHVFSISNISRFGNLGVGELVVRVINTDDQWNNFISTEGELSKSGQVNLYHAGDAEYMPMFTGEVVKAPTVPGQQMVDLIIRDRLAVKLDGPLGSPQDPKDYTDTGRTPAELIWKILTEEADFDTTINQTNPDFDWLMFGDFQGYTSSQNLSVKAYFYGNTIRSAIREILRISSGMGWITNEGKLGLTQADVSEVVGDDTWTREHIIEMTPVPNIENITNKQYTYWGYDYETGSWEGNIELNDAVSQGHYGLHEAWEASALVWHDDQPSAVGGRDWIDSLWDGKRIECSITVPWYGFRMQIGDILDITDAEFGFNNDIFKVLAVENINFDDYTITVNALLKP